MLYRIFLFAAVVCNVLAQTLMKYSLSRTAKAEAAPLLQKIVSTVFQPLFLLALLAYGAGIVLYAVCLTKIELSRAYPISSIAAIILITIVSLLFFNEAFSVFKIIGLAVCLVGIILIFI